MYRTFKDFQTFRYLRAGQTGDALGLGAPDGGDLLPISHRLTSVTILEPRIQLRAESVTGMPITYRDPAASGLRPFDDALFDLVTAFGVLHPSQPHDVLVDEVRRVFIDAGVIYVYTCASSCVEVMGDSDGGQSRAGLKRKRVDILELIYDIMILDRVPPSLWSGTSTQWHTRTAPFSLLSGGVRTRGRGDRASMPQSRVTPG